MNERIRELMVELKKTVSTHRGEAVLIGYDEIEKFAELIVRECISKCDGNGEYKNHTDTEFGQGVAAGIKIAKAQIKQHFGVEE